MLFAECGSVNNDPNNEKNSIITPVSFNSTQMFYDTTMASSVMSDRTETIHSLSIQEILEAVPRHTFKASERRSRANLDAAIYNLPQETYNFLVGASAAKHCHLESTSTSRVVLPDPFLPNVDSSSDDNDDCRRQCVADCGLDRCHQSRSDGFIYLHHLCRHVFPDRNRYHDLIFYVNNVLTFCYLKKLFFCNLGQARL